VLLAEAQIEHFFAHYKTITASRRIGVNDDLGIRQRRYTDQLADIVRHPGFQKAYRDIRDGIEQCRATCGYFSVCGGGNPSNKLAESGSFATTETQYCRLHVKTFAAALLADLEREMGLV
jgi:radical SAM protein with 4Fe4S-binding SPASM domain